MIVARDLHRSRRIQRPWSDGGSRESFFLYGFFDIHILQLVSTSMWYQNMDIERVSASSQGISMLLWTTFVPVDCVQKSIAVEMKQAVLTKHRGFTRPKRQA